jgi:uncharacterized protein (DUF2147 family)
MEAPMKKTFYLAAAAALLMASTSAHAGNGISFEIDGQKIHIEAARNCSSLSCLSVTNNGSAVNLKNINLKGKKSSDDDDVATTSAPAKVQQPAQAPAPAPLPVANTPPPPPPPAPVASNVSPPPAPPAPVADSGTRERISGLPATSDARAPVTPTAAPVAPASVASNNPPAVQATPAAQALPPAAAPTTPVGLWQTADDKGNVRIEQCGANLCGYAEKTNEKILINMKPSDSKWVGRIHDPDSGSNYDSTIAMKGPNILKVQGCAFGGLFCGGQTWKRIS